MLEDLSDEKVDFDVNEDDLLSSQELEEFAKDTEEEQTDFQTKTEEMISVPQAEDENQELKGKKLLEKTISTTEGIRKSSRFEKMKILKLRIKQYPELKLKMPSLTKV
jgi:hypothetical protein